MFVQNKCRTRNIDEKYIAKEIPRTSFNFVILPLVLGPIAARKLISVVNIVKACNYRYIFQKPNSKIIRANR